MEVIAVLNHHERVQLSVTLHVLLDMLVDLRESPAGDVFSVATLFVNEISSELSTDRDVPVAHLL